MTNCIKEYNSEKLAFLLVKQRCEEIITKIAKNAKKTTSIPSNFNIFYT